MQKQDIIFNRNPHVGTTLNLYAASIRKPFLLIISMAAKALKQDIIS